MNNSNLKPLLLFFLIILSSSADADFEYSAEIGSRVKLFEPDDIDQTKDYQLDLKTKFQSDYQGESLRIHFGFFSRVDQNDSQRGIINFDEAYLKQEFNNFSYSIGNHIFNWSVMEIFHPVDTINAKNFDSNGDLTERLGQPSLILKQEFESSFLEFIVFVLGQRSILPGSSNRNGAIVNIGTGKIVDLEDSRYVNNSNQTSTNPNYLEYIIRYQHSFENIDIDIHWAHKYDTNNPLISTPKPSNSSPTIFDLEITPYYLKYDQYGLTAQFNLDSYLIKLEAAHYDYTTDTVEVFFPPTVLTTATREDYSLFAFGIERSFTYSNDSEGSLFIEYQSVFGTTIEDARTLSPFQRDLAIGYRHNFNDFKGNDITALIITDIDQGQERIYSLSHSLRVADSWKLESGIRIIEAINPKDGLELSNFEGLRSIANGDSFNIELIKYF